MPSDPSMEQRIEWHVGHAVACGCREIPPGVAAEIQHRAKPST